MPLRPPNAWSHFRVVLLWLLPAGAWAAGENIFGNGLEGGFDCTAAPPASVAVDVRSARVTPVFRHNGVPFQSSPAHSATFFLVPREGEPVLLGTSFDPPANGVRVVTGVYDVEYRWRSGDQVPRNVAARVLQGVLVAADRELLIDVPSTSLRGDLRMNGASFPQTGVNVATLSLEGIHALGRVVLGSSNQANYNVRLIPGAYHLLYQSSGVGGPIPANQDALRERHDIEFDTAARNFDIPAIVTIFQFRLAGAAFPASAVENGILSLRSAHGDYVEIGESRAQLATIRLIPDTYDAYWEGLLGAIVPANPDTRFLRDRTIAAPVEELDVPVVEVAGDFTVNGLPTPASQTENGRVRLRDASTGGEVVLGHTNVGSFERRVIPGIYDLVYEGLTGGNVMPLNPRVVFERDRDVAAAPLADIDIQSAALDWQLTLNGAPFPDSQTENARITARSGGDLLDTLLGDTTVLGGTGSQRLVPGNYRPLYAQVLGAVVPVNSRAALDGVFVVTHSGVGTQTMDVRAGAFSFSFLHNGVAFADDPARSATFALKHREDLVAIGSTEDSVGPRVLIASVLPLGGGRTATVHYTWQAGELHAMPQNLDHPVACYVLQAP